MGETSATLMVLDKGFVKLVDYMGSDLRTVQTARISFGKTSEKLDDKDRRLIRYLAHNKHTSPFRGNVVTIHVKCPLFVARQWWKHVVGGDYQFKDTQWNEISGRYTETSTDCYFPLNWRRQSNDNKQASEGVVADQEECDQAFHYAMAAAVNTYNTLISRGVAREQARICLPQNIYTEFYWTASLQALVHFVKLRADSHAQLEIREYAKAIEKIVYLLFPESWNALKNSEEN